jgi:hypothetical protein
MGDFTISRHGRTRFWAVRDASGELICVCAYKRGATEVARRLGAELSYCLRDASSLAESPPESGQNDLRDLPDSPPQG